LLEQPTEGEVRLDGEPVCGGPARSRPTAAARRRVTLVEQRPVLFRGTVRENLGYGLVVRGVRRIEVNRVVDNVAARFGIAPLRGRRARPRGREALARHAGESVPRRASERGRG